MWRIPAICAALAIMSCGPARAGTFSVMEDTSPYPAPGIRAPYGAQTMVSAAITCRGASASLEVPTGADTASISLPADENGLGIPLALFAEQDSLDPSTLLLTLRIGTVTARGELAAGGGQSLSLPDPDCPGAISVTLSDEALSSGAQPVYVPRSTLVPFPAEKQ